MTRTAIFIATIAMLCATTACKKTEQFSNGGTLHYNGKNYTLQSVRQHYYIDSITGDARISAAFCSGNMTFADGKMAGYGALLVLNTATDSTQLHAGVYDLSDQSYLILISKDHADTTTTAIDSGTLEISTTQHGLHYDFAANANAITGTYEGTHTHFYDADGAPVGLLQLGDSIIPLQRGERIHWGTIFDPNLNYNEFYLYSCNLRRADDGTAKQGLMLVVGVQTTNNAPTTGTYNISSANISGTALYGHKSGSMDWGTYYTLFVSKSAKTKNNILSGHVTIDCKNDLYTLDFDCTDQFGTAITGHYESDFDVITMN